MKNLPYWFILIAALVIAAILLNGWYELKRAERMNRRRKKIRDALDGFRIARTYAFESGQEEVFLYSAENSKRLLELENQIVKYGHGSGQWLYFLPERRLFFILELVAADDSEEHELVETIHPIKPERAKQVLTRHPELYKQIFREEI